MLKDKNFLNKAYMKEVLKIKILTHSNSYPTEKVARKGVPESQPGSKLVLSWCEIQR